MEAAEFIECLETTERGNVSDTQSQAGKTLYVITVRLTETDHQMLQQLKEQTGQDDDTAIRTSLRLFTAMMASSDTNHVRSRFSAGQRSASGPPDHRDRFELHR